MRSLLVCCLALAACLPIQTSAAPTPSTAPATPQVAPGPTARAPLAARAVDCPVERLAPSPESVVVVLADGETKGTASIIDVASQRVVARVELGYQPVVELDLKNRQLLVICSPDANTAGTELIALGLDDLAIRWRVPLADRLLMKISTLPGVLASSVDGLYVLTQHYQVLRPGDPYAPGNGRWWFEVRDARTGAQLRSVELSACGVGLFYQATPDLVFVSCTHGMSRLIRTDTWQTLVTHATSSSFRLGALTASGDHFIGVTHDFWVLTSDVKQGRQTAASHWADTAMPVVPLFDRLAMSSDGSRLWVPTSAPSFEFGAGTALVAVDLRSGTHREHPAQRLEAVARSDDRVLYVDGGRLRTLDRPGEVDLSVSHRVTTWRIAVGAGG